MAEIKTKVTNASVTAYLKTIEPPNRKSDGLSLLKIFEEVTGEKGKLWGTSIIGFGQYHYESTRSSQKGDWPLTGFAVRKQNLTLYIMPGFKDYSDLLAKLGKYKSSVSCLYIKSLDDIHIPTLKKLIQLSVSHMKKKYV